MLDDQTVRKSIYASVIASVVVIVIIKPILGITGKLIIWLGSNIYEGFSNSLYREAALGLREKYSFILLMMFLAITTGTIVGVTIIRYLKRKMDSEPKKQKSYKFVYFWAIIVSLLVLDAFYLLSYNFAAFQMNSSFQQRLTVLAPNITDNELKQIKAKWASMEKRYDYDNLTEEMERLAKSKNVKLPKALWK